MAQTTARIKKEGKNFEVLVDLDEALKFKKGESSIGQAVLTQAVFHNLKSGEHASTQDMEKVFGSSDFESVAEKIIKSGEIVLPTDFKRSELDKKYKQVVDFLSKNATSAEGRQYTEDRILKALQEAHVNIKNKPIESQIPEILDQLSKILPIKIETKKVRVTVPAQFTGHAYGVLQEYKDKEEWLNNGDLVIDIAVPAGLLMDFYDRLNSITHGNALTEELK